ncbi:MAG: hypothetical protein H5U07_00935 [Candidatus Aminicenantes bacterium]|nr:hypothetical protein [Candidatus Aminicenantes bacterium]
MKKLYVAFIMLSLILFFVGCWLFAQEQENKAISWENWREAREMAEKYDQEGDYTKALQYYLEYVRQAEGLGRPDLVAWGKNNAAYMIIKQHKQDPATDLRPAKKLLEEALAITEASEDCKIKLQSNLAYVKMFITD